MGMVPPPSTQMAETGNLGSEAQAYHPSSLPTPSLPPEPGLRSHWSPSPPANSSSTSYLLPQVFSGSPRPIYSPHSSQEKKRKSFQSTLIHSSLAENPSGVSTHLGNSAPTQDGHKASPSPPPMLSVPPPLYPENLSGGAPLLQHTDPSTCQVVHSATFQSSRRSRLPQPPT